MSDILAYQNFTPYVDICVMVLSVTYALLLRTTYTVKEKNLNLFRISNLLVFVAAFSSVILHYTLDKINSHNVFAIYFTRDITYIALSLTLVIFYSYIANVVRLTGKSRRIRDIIVWSVFGLFVLWEVTTPITHLGFYIDSNINIHDNYYSDVFWVVYIFYAVFLTILINKSKSKLISNFYSCIKCIMGISVFIMLIQIIFEQYSFTCLTFSLPLLTVLFLFHYNAFDPTTGTLDGKVFNSYILDLGKKEFTMICLQLYDLKPERIQEMTSEFFHFNERFFKHGCTFRIRDDKFVLVYEDAKNINAALIMPKLYEDFKKSYNKYKLDYKIIVLHSSTELSKGEEYILLNDFLDEKLPNNSFYECKREDVKDFLKASYIINQLRDIRKQNNLCDERVKVYCQPVLNTETGTFTSAEALMRLQLPDIGLVFPDIFIPLAEKNDCIHTLSKIILNKTCKQIKELEANGYEIDRISVNFAMSELKINNFCDEIKQIISDNDIPCEKIAMELTESMNESEYENVKHIMGVLHSVGMKFYLDDFGTGYSNIERIIKLPIDIIKFDRSLTIMANNDENSKHMVEGFTDIFKKSDYKILFEGVETESDEQQCKNMNALYLQGYKYSKPIPIERLSEFLVKN